MKKNLYYIGPEFMLSGSTFVMLDMLNNLDKEVFNLHYFMLSEANFKEHGLKNNIQIINLENLRSWWARSFIYKLRKWYVIFKTLKQNADVLMVDHREYIYPILRFKKIFGLNCRIVCRWGNIPSYTIKHGSKEHNFCKKYFRNADMFIVPSNVSKREFKTFFDFPEEKLKVVYNTLNKERFQHSPTDKKEDNDKFIILYIGLMIPRKNPECLLEAFTKLHREIKDKKLELWMVGNGELLPSLKQKAEQNGISDSVKFIKEIQDPSALYNNADVFVHTSHYDGFGIVISEAIYYNLPIIYAKATVGAVELLEKYNIGTSYQKADVYDLSVKIKQIFEGNYKPLIQNYHNYLTEVSKEKFIEGYQNALLNN